MRLIFSFVILCLILSFQNGTAEVISVHNVQYTAVDAARWALQSQTGCAEAKTKQATTDRYKAIFEGGRYFVEGGRLEVICIKSGFVKLTWTPPTQRADGSDLPSSQISGYDILKDGQPFDFVQCCEYVTKSTVGITIRTVDTAGLVSSEASFGE